MNTKELAELLKRTVPAGLPTLVLGAPGLGKSAIHRQVVEELGYDFRIIYPAILDPVDLGGLPIPDGGRVRRLLDDQMFSLIETRNKTVLLLDEIGQASPAMQAACAPLILEKTLGGKKLPEHMTICAAGNRAQDRAGAFPILTHIISRMATVVTLEAEPRSWCDWATASRLSSDVISYIRFRPKMLHDFDANPIYDTGSAYPCPRSWQYISRLIAVGVDDMASLAGCIGKGAAMEFIAHRKLCKAQISAEEFLNNPRKWKLPKELGARYAIVSALAAWVNEKTLSALINIAEKLILEAPEYSALLIRDVFNAHKELSLHPAMLQATSGKLGEMIRSI